jgi:hypothetical protein
MSTRHSTCALYVVVVVVVQVIVVKVGRCTIGGGLLGHDFLITLV